MSRGERRFRLVLLVLEFGVLGAVLIWTMTVWPRMPGHVALGVKSDRLGLPIVPNWVLLAQLAVVSTLMAWTIWQTVRGPVLERAVTGLALAMFFALIPVAAMMSAVYGTGQTASALLLGGFLVAILLLAWISQKVAPSA